MVTCAHPRLGYRKPSCPSRLLLLAAHRSLTSGDTLAAGCKMREATVRYLSAMCESHQLPRAKSPYRLAKLLLQTDQFDEGGYDWIVDMLKCGDKCARCKHVRRSLVETCCSLLHLLLDHSPEIEFPTREGGAV